MNIIHKFVASLVKPHLLFKVLVGMAITAVTLNLLNPSAEELRNLLINIGYPTAIMFPITWGVMAVFYGELYGIYWPSGLGWHFNYLSYDPYFYQTITSKISLFRKFLGYIYALTKILCSLGISFALTACIYQIIQSS